MAKEPAKPSSWERRGFRQLARHGDVGNPSVQLLARRAPRYGYAVARDPTGLWMRRVGRGRGEPYTPAASISAVVSAGDSRVLHGAFLDGYLASPWAAIGRPAVDIDALRGAVAEHTKPAMTAQDCYSVSLAVLLCPPRDLPQFLAREVLPRFLAAQPRGRVVVVEYDALAEKQLAMLRAGYVLRHYSPDELKSAGVRHFPSLAEWQQLDAHHFVDRTLSMTKALCYPEVPWFRASPPGLTLLFVFDQGVRQQFARFPRDWMSWWESEADFAAEDVDALAISSEPSSPEGRRATHRRRLSAHVPSVEERLALIRWTVDRASLLWAEMTDPCNFLTDGVIDFTWAMEHALTIDRAIRMSILATSGTSSIGRRASTFEVADLLSEVARAWGEVDDAPAFMKSLFNPRSARRRVANCLVGAPPIVSRLAGTDVLYDALRAAIRDSIWYPPDRTHDRILVRTRDLTSKVGEDLDDFVANVMRSLRNGHHGYFTKLDRSNRPTRYLLPVTGNVPDSMSALPLIWSTSLLSSPDAFIGWKTLPLQACD